MHLNQTAVEFFSGIGAFRQVSMDFGINLVGAFDQGEDANETYEINYKHRPNTRNLDSISKSDIPESNVWWLSPPCLPYTRKGSNRDVDDPRAASLLNLIELIPEFLPQRIFLENVPEFKTSKAKQVLEKKLEHCKYRIRDFELCSSNLGTPMLRRRFFLIASRLDEISELDLTNSFSLAAKKLSDYLLCQGEIDPALYLSTKQLELSRDSFDIVTKDSERVTCFTSSYGRQHKASGSVLMMPDGKIRYFSPNEILSLLGFQASFSFPEHMSIKTRWRLTGNSVDTRIIRLLFKASGL